MKIYAIFTKFWNTPVEELDFKELTDSQYLDLRHTYSGLCRNDDSISFIIEDVVTGNSFVAGDEFEPQVTDEEFNKAYQAYVEYAHDVQVADIN